MGKNVKFVVTMQVVVYLEFKIDGQNFSSQFCCIWGKHIIPTVVCNKLNIAKIIVESLFI